MKGENNFKFTPFFVKENKKEISKINLCLHLKLYLIQIQNAYKIPKTLIFIPFYIPNS